MPKNHWRLSPAFDVVPNPDEHPRTLTMQLSLGRYDISRDAVLADTIRFCFDHVELAEAHLDRFIDRLSQAFTFVRPLLALEVKALMESRLHNSLQLLSKPRV